MKNKIHFVDVHCHLEMCAYINGLIERMKCSDVEIVISNGVNPESNRKTIGLSKTYPQIKVALGAYPIDALKLDNQKIDSEIDFIRENKDKLVAIGEVGLDFKEDSEQHGRQIEILKKFIRLAIELKKPVIVHSRKAELECIEILEKENAKKAVMHCFSGKFSLVERIVKNNWSLTIPTSVKFSEHFQKIAEKVPIENLFCETDSPFLHPDKLRNNEPANVVVSYQKIAEIKKMPLEEVKKKIFENYERLFCSQVTQIALSNQKPKSQQRL